jgi:eukaryotic-like serine/threonine-protein kinase
VGAKSEIPPDTLLGGKIRLIQRIGRGGMGDVWIARNEATQAEVAVKTLQIVAKRGSPRRSRIATSFASST